jgi:hypothetical protein
MDNPDIIYTTLKNKLRENLVPIGYCINREEFHSSFGSNYVEFQLKTQVIRLIWDNRDSRFVLEICEDVRNTISMQKYRYLVDLPFEKNNENEDANTLLIATLEKAISDLINNFGTYSI